LKESVGFGVVVVGSVVMRSVVRRVLWRRWLGSAWGPAFSTPLPAWALTLRPRGVGQVLNGAAPPGCARKVGAARLRAYSLAQPPGRPRLARSQRSRAN